MDVCLHDPAICMVCMRRTNQVCDLQRRMPRVISSTNENGSMVRLDSAECRTAAASTRTIIVQVHISCLQGGKEAKHSNRVLHDIIVRAVEEEAPEVGRDLIGLVTSREGVAELLVHDDVIDLVIPRGSNALVSSLVETPLAVCLMPRHADNSDVCADWQEQQLQIMPHVSQIPWQPDVFPS